VTAHPNAEWIARQLTEAYGWNEPPRCIILDRDGAYGAAYIRRLRAIGIRDRFWRRSGLDLAPPSFGLSLRAATSVTVADTFPHGQGQNLRSAARQEMTALPQLADIVGESRGDRLALRAGHAALFRLG
jgi:hypothetical protein